MDMRGALPTPGMDMQTCITMHGRWRLCNRVYLIMQGLPEVTLSCDDGD